MEKPTIVITFNDDPEFIEAIDRVVREQDMNRSQFIRRALRAYLALFLTNSPPEWTVRPTGQQPATEPIATN